MMHIGRLIARLNPTTVRYDIGRGGVPELTAQDVAAALGCVRNKLGAELLCVAHGDVTSALLRQVEDHLAAAQRGQWWTGEEAMQAAMLAIAVHEGGESKRRSQSLYATAHARRWPQWIDNPELGTHSEGYGRVRLGVLAEIRNPTRCHVCGGRGEHPDETGVVKACGTCRGIGSAVPSGRSRAAILGIDEAPYRRKWQRVYEWTLALCADAMLDAAIEVHGRLG